MTREQFIELVKGEQDALRHYLLALCCGDMATADDIAQETLVKAYLSILSFSGKGKLRSWIFAIAHNTFLNHQKAIRTHETLEEAKTVAGNRETDYQYAHYDLYLALSTLPPKERSAITLFYLSGYSVKEIASISGNTEDAVKKQLSRGRDKLKTILKR